MGSAFSNVIPFPISATALDRLERRGKRKAQPDPQRLSEALAGMSTALDQQRHSSRAWRDALRAMSPQPKNAPAKLP